MAAEEHEVEADNQDTAAEKQEVQDEDDEEIVPLGGWESAEHRARILADCAFMKPSEERIVALLEIRQLALLQENQISLWQDVELHDVVLMCAEPPDPDAGADPYAESSKEKSPLDRTVRLIALSILPILTADPINRRQMVIDKKLREVLVAGTDQHEEDSSGFEHPLTPEQHDMRRRTCLTIGVLALAGACLKAGKDYEEAALAKLCPECGVDDCVHMLLRPALPSSDTDLIEALVTGADSSEDTETRVAVLGAFWSLAASSDIDAVSLWRIDNLQRTLFYCAGSNELDVVREHALGAIWAFSVQEENKESMWNTDLARKVILAGAGFERPSSRCTDRSPQTQSLEVRLKALGTLASLAKSPTIREAMWADRYVAKVLLDATNDEEEQVRTEALRALLQLASHEANLKPMALDGVSGLLETAAEDKELDAKQRRYCAIARDRLLLVSTS